MSRRGWTVVELLVVVTVSAVLAALVSGVVIASARVAARQASSLEHDRTGLTVAAWWHVDLRDSESGDVAVPAADRLVAHHPVGAAVPCLASGADILIARADWRGGRDPEPARDELWLLTDVTTSAWDEAPLVAVASGLCPGGAPAIRLTLAATVAAVQLVRVVEPLQMRLYRSGNGWWLGLAPADGATPVQPFAGPIAVAVSGFARDTSGVHVFVQPAAGRLFELHAPLPSP